MSSHSHTCLQHAHLATPPHWRTAYTLTLHAHHTAFGFIGDVGVAVAVYPVRGCETLAGATTAGAHLPSGRGMLDARCCMHAHLPAPFTHLPHTPLPPLPRTHQRRCLHTGISAAAQRGAATLRRSMPLHPPRALPIVYPFYTGRGGTGTAPLARRATPPRCTRIPLPTIWRFTNSRAHGLPCHARPAQPLHWPAPLRHLGPALKHARDLPAMGSPMRCHGPWRCTGAARALPSRAARHMAWRRGGTPYAGAGLMPVPAHPRHRRRAALQAGRRTSTVPAGLTRTAAPRICLLTLYGCAVWMAHTPTTSPWTLLRARTGGNTRHMLPALPACGGPAPCVYLFRGCQRHLCHAGSTLAFIGRVALHTTACFLSYAA